MGLIVKRDWAGLFKAVGSLYLILLVICIFIKLYCGGVVGGCAVDGTMALIASVEWLMFPVVPLVFFLHLVFGSFGLVIFAFYFVIGFFQNVGKNLGLNS